MHWLGRLLAWDGVLPLIVWAIPAILQRVIPNERAMVMLSAVMLPVAAVVVRFYVGKAIIDANGCTPRFRTVQMISLCVGLFVLMCLDSLLVALLSLDLPAPGLDGLAAMMLFGMFYLPYLAFLAVAMYPGPRRNDEAGETVAPTRL